jgi:putative transposase
LDKNLSTVYSQVLYTTQEKVELAFQGFFRRLKTAKPGEKFGFPKPKEEGRLRSLIYPQSGFKFLPKHVELSKVGKIKAVFHRQVDGKVKRVSLVKYPSGKYFLCVNAEVDIVPQKPLTDSMPKAVGIDLGVSHFAVLSDGRVFDSTKPLKAAKKLLAKTDRLNKPKALAQERVANRRSDFLHKLANKLVQAYDIIAVEDLDVKQMQAKKPGFSKDFRRAIADNGWSIFINMLQYKAVIAGKRVVLVDPAFTSQDCSQCGSRQKLDLSDRTYNCPTCGLYLCRDANAARNILRLGMQSLSENL